VVSPLKTSVQSTTSLLQMLQSSPSLSTILVTGLLNRCQMLIGRLRGFQFLDGGVLLRSIGSSVKLSRKVLGSKIMSLMFTQYSQLLSIPT